VFCEISNHRGVTIDWTLRENARSKIKLMVKRILQFYRYPPDLQDEAVQTVLLQAETRCKNWVAESRSFQKATHAVLGNPDSGRQFSQK
jgi:type I restriction enzyme R subunit